MSNAPIREVRKLYRVVNAIMDVAAIASPGNRLPEGWKTYTVVTVADSINRRWQMVEWMIEAPNSADAMYAARMLHAPKVGYRSVWVHEVTEV